MSEAAMLADQFNLLDKAVLNIYHYGSRVYGTASQNSDRDFIIVIAGEAGYEDNRRSRDNMMDATVYDTKAFQAKVDDHEISVLECLFLKPTLKVCSLQDYPWILNRNKLRESLSAKSSNSWVKAKKKFTVENEPYIAKKSLFHSLRILKFGIQIASAGLIQDYTAANDLWAEIRDNPSNNWDDYKNKYQALYNALKTEFRLVAPKEHND